MRVIAVTNQKGGVGKTTVTYGLAGALARMGRRVTLIDLDPQMTLSNVILEPEDLETLPTVDELLVDPAAGLSAATVETKWGFSLVPSRPELAQREQNRTIGDEYNLAEAIEASEDQPDVVLIDCPPSLGLLTLTALMAASDVLLVTESTFAALGGTSLFLNTLDSVAKIKGRQNSPLRLAGVIVSQLRNTVEQRGHLAELETTFGDRLWSPFVPHTVAAESMFDQGVPAHAVSSRTGSRRLALAFDELAGRVASLDHTAVA